MNRRFRIGQINPVLFTGLILSFSAVHVYCQSDYSTISLRGHIVDKVNANISFANVALLKSADSSSIAIITCDEQGRFHFDSIPNIPMALVITRIGYLDYSQSLDNTKTSTREIQLPDIILAQEQNSLGGVVVQSRKPLVQFRPDRTILNVAGSINSIGTTAFELLRKAPGVRINNESTISINGKNGLQIYLDGKPTNLTGGDLVQFLKTTPSSNIESIEIITNPSSKYDAGGNAGIINIKTKVNLNYGFNVNMSGTTQFGSYKPKYDGAININYRNNVFNVYAGYNYLNGKYRSVSDLFRAQSVGASTIFFRNPYRNYNFPRTHNYKAGIDYKLGAKSNLGLGLNGSFSDTKSLVDGRTEIFRDPSTIDSILISLNNQTQDVSRIRYNANYRFADTLGNELSADINYGTYIANGESFQPNKYVNGSGSLLSEKNYTSSSKSKIFIKSGKIDYQKKVWGGALGTGIKLSSIKSDNDLDFFVLNGNVPKVDTGRTNAFLYKENIQAAYIHFDRSIKKWSLSLGVRAERTDVTGVLSALTVSNLRTLDSNYLNLFPNGLITYKVNKNNNLSISYNKRIDRPFYGDLNPFEFVANELLFMKGNPFLKPQYTHTFKVSHDFKQKLFTSVTYDYIKDYMTGMSDTLGNGRTFVSSLNISSKKIVGIHASWSQAVSKWWDLNLSVNARREKVKGKVRNNQFLNQSQNTWDVYVNNSFKIGKTMSAELSGFYNSSYMDAPAILKPQYSADFGFRKRFFKDALVASMAVSDIFNSLNVKVHRDFGGLRYDGRFKWETRILRFSLSYKFGNKNVKRVNERNSGMDDELRRIK